MDRVRKVILSIPAPDGTRLGRNRVMYSRLLICKRLAPTPKACNSRAQGRGAHPGWKTRNRSHPNGVPHNRKSSALVESNLICDILHCNRNTIRAGLGVALLRSAVWARGSRTQGALRDPGLRREIASRLVWRLNPSMPSNLRLTLVPLRALLPFAALIVLLLFPASAFAHKLYIYPESIEGGTIHGRAYFPGDLPAQHIEVIVRNASGRELGRTTTDDKGKFTVPARQREDLVLVAETPDGHTGTYTIHAAELPDKASAGSTASENGEQAQPSPAVPSSMPAKSTTKEIEVAAIRDQLTELDSQIKMLRRQVSDAEERLRFRDILGGIGFIVGLAGVAYYMKARTHRA
jgi:nickel transport protein